MMARTVFTGQAPKRFHRPTHVTSLISGTSGLLCSATADLSQDHLPEGRHAAC